MQELAIDFDSDLSNEYLYGRAGYLYSLMYVNRNIQPSPIPEDRIREASIHAHHFFKQFGSSL